MLDLRRRWADHAVTALVLVATWAFLLHYYKPSLLFLDTMDGGGDTPSFMRPIHHLRDVLLPAGNPLGWDLGNFAGYAPYQFYFLPPALGIVLMSYVIPFNVAFKLMTVLGVFLLPLSATIAMRAMALPFPVPALAAPATLIFLFNEGNSMWGGNIPSTLAGEFAHSIAFALAVLFLGLLYRGVERQRGWRGLGVLLGLTGLCHPVAFINAASAGIFFVLGRQSFVRNLRFLLLVYGTSVLVMGFWLVPLIAKLGYATSINWVWHFNSLWDLLPRILWIPLALAALDIVWALLRRRPQDRPARYLATTIAVSIVFFFNATEVGLPEIRFVPFVYLLAVLLALDFVRRILPLGLAPRVGAIAVAVGLIVAVHSQVTFIPSWITWNYSGLERKATWPLFQAINKAVAGTIADPRVAYENSPQHDRFGSMRVFENIPLFSGRPTLEGVLLQTSVNSPFIYWLQSQISKQGTGVIPGYSYPTLDLARATPRLALYNARDIIVVTPEVTKQLEADARWERTFQQSSYSVFRLKEHDPHYVRVPAHWPVRVKTASWKRDFHRWFATDGVLDVPIVADDQIRADDRARFPLESDAPTTLPRQAIDRSCAITESIDHFAIEFTTTCPGQPHVISVSYFPNWTVEGASRIHLVSPAFMLVFPDGERVRLTYRRLFVDWLGLLFTVAGIALCVATRQRAPLPEPSGALAQGLGRLHPALVGVFTVAVLGITIWHAGRQFGPQYFYQRGWTAFTAQDYATSQRYFELAKYLGGTNSQAADATFFRAASLLRSGKPGEALAGYEDVIRAFPDSIWVVESHYHVGVCLRQLGKRQEAAEKFRWVIEQHPGNRWAGFAREQLQQMEAEPGGLGAS